MPTTQLISPREAAPRAGASHDRRDDHRDDHRDDERDGHRAVDGAPADSIVHAPGVHAPGIDAPGVDAAGTPVPAVSDALLAAVEKIIAPVVPVVAPEPNASREPAKLAPRDKKTTKGAGLVNPTVWQQILAAVRAAHPSLQRLWFDQMVPRQLTNGVIQVTVDSPAQLNFCQSQCQQPFTTAAQAITGRLIAVSFHCDRMSTGGVFNESDQVLPLNPDYVFDQFVTGPCNRLPHAASLAVSEQPGKAYNPLFIHGGVGLGKTHLLQAICQTLLERQPELRIMYLSCDSFINQFIHSVENNDMSGFRHRYRHADVLVIDDIHFLSGRDRTQEEFFHTFNTLYQSHKQIILSADCPPSEIPELEERLISRFNWGLVARIEKPCYETRVAILKKKARMRGLTLPDDVVCYIAAKVENNTRELEGAITKVQGMSLLSGGVIDMETAKGALGDTATPEQKRITIQQIIDAVVKYYNVKPSDLQGKRRHKSIAFPRQVCMYLARRHTRYSLQEIGGYFGGRDHTTVMHAVKTVEEDRTADREIEKQVAHLENVLTGAA